MSSYYIRHLIKVKGGSYRSVDFKQVIVETCKGCKKEVPQIFFGLDRLSVCAVEAVYKYRADDIVSEQSTLKKSMIPSLCSRKGCSRHRYM